MVLCHQDWDLSRMVVSQCRNDFTLAFESVISLTISTIIVITALFSIYRASLAKLSKPSGNKRSSVQILLVAFLCIADLLAFIAWVTLTSLVFNQTLGLATVVLQFLSTICLAVMVLVQNTAPNSQNYVSSICVLIQIGWDAVRLRTFTSVCAPHYFFASFTASLAVKLGMFAVKNLWPYPIEEKNLKPTFLNHVFLLWVWSLMIKGWKRNLVLDDLPNIVESSEDSFGSSDSHWRARLRKEHLTTILFRAYKWKLILPVALGIASAVLLMCLPLLLKALLIFLASRDSSNAQPQLTGWFIVVVYSLTTWLSAITEVQFRLACSRLGVLLRSTLMQAIYRKALRIDKFVMANNVGVGRLSSYLSVDVERIVLMFDFVFFVVQFLVLLILGLAIIYLESGWKPTTAMVAFLTLAFVSLPFMTKGLSHLQSTWSHYTDERIKLLSSVLNCIRAVKFANYEGQAFQKYNQAREKELQAVKRYRTRWTFSGLYINYAFAGMRFVLMATFALADPNRFRSPAALILQAVLYTWTASYFELAINFGKILSGLSSLTRINDYLVLKEKTLQVSTCNFPEEIRCKMDGNTDIELQNASFAVDGVRILSNLDVTFPAQKLTILTGPVASGKSSVLSAILGEMDLVEGAFHLGTQSFALCSQEPIIRNHLSIQENILFMLPMDKNSYQRVVHACALDVDFNEFQNGDQGLAAGLSGGQRARVALARAIYADTDIVLLDDPFSALDVLVARHCFNSLFGSSGLLKGKTVIFVTIDLEHLKNADHIVSMEECRIIQSMSATPLHNVKALYKSGRGKFGFQNTYEDGLTQKEGFVTSGELAVNLETSIPLLSTTASIWLYICNAPWRLNILAIALSSIPFPMFTTGFLVYVDFWLRNYNAYPARWVGGFAALSGVYALFATMAWTNNQIYYPDSTHRKIHKDQVDGLLNAPIVFFTKYNTGFILNRFSTDVFVMETEFQMGLADLLITIGNVLSLAILAIVATPYAALILFFLLVSGDLSRRFYARTSTQLRGAESSSKSPFYSAANEVGDPNTLQLFRAFNKEHMLEEEATRAIDLSNKPSFLLRVARHWLALQAAHSSSLLVLVLLVIAVSQSGESHTYLSLGLVQAVSLPQLLNAILFQITDVEINSIAVARTDWIAKQAHEDRDRNSKADDHRREKLVLAGCIQFLNVSMRYQPDAPLVLRNVSSSISAGTKVGICGRTGSGKSTLVATLFRLYDIESGSIQIDGHDIGKLNRFALRNSMSMIPQDSMMLNLTIRENIDPEGVFNDFEIWNALEKTHCKGSVMALPGGLDYRIDSNAARFSRGQQQLMALARAYLRQRKVLCLDESSSSLDLATDTLVQNTLRTSFVDCTLIVIAHRISTIIDLDWIICMHAGVIVEQGSPEDLLATPNSYFRRLARKGEEVDDSS